MVLIRFIDRDKAVCQVGRGLEYTEKASQKDWGGFNQN